MRITLARGTVVVIGQLTDDGSAMVRVYDRAGDEVTLDALVGALTRANEQVDGALRISDPVNIATAIVTAVIWDAGHHGG